VEPNPYPDETSQIDAYFKAEVRKRYAVKGVPYPNERSDRWFSRLGYRSSFQAFDEATGVVLTELEAELGIVPEPPAVPPPGDGPTKPLDGYLRAVGSVWHDDSGPRAVRLCSYFPAVRVYRDNRALFLRNLDAMVGYWQGARVFWCLMGKPWSDFGLEVDPRWPNFDELFTGVLNEFAARGLRVALTSGTLHPHQLPAGDVAATYQRIGRLCASVNQQTVVAHSVINEPGATSPYGDEPAAWPSYYKFLTAFKNAYPWNHHGTGCQGHDPEAVENGGAPSGVILGSKSPATMACVQGTRYPVRNALERAFDMGYRVRPAVRVPVLEEEPSGNNGMLTGPGSVFQPMSDRDTLLAYYTLKIITGQALISLNSCGLCEQNPLDSVWGFREIPALWAQMGIPEDIGTFTVGNLNQHPVTATGVYRCDGSWHDGRGLAFAVASGGAEWRVTSRWAAQARVYRADGLHLDKHVDAGETIFREGGEPVPTVIVLVRS
jgi:hypothetical protein